MASHFVRANQHLHLCDPQANRVVDFDLNKDNRPDVWKHYAGKALVCKRVDMNHDGKVDYWAAYARGGGRLYERFDFDFDGKPDAHTEHDPVARKKLFTARDSNFDSKFDILEIYDPNGKRTQTLRDRNANGTADVWEIYAGGKLRETLFDDDHDGKVDRHVMAP